ncbi:4'-phosphopantetheinyl transferase superfamily protein [Actinomyces israelii]|uniref:4'-phosphopantetheinyl transferase superfamily protein n=1 Tax=Actinomyces israelii TaxID=1659 RepID=UPI003C6CA873
MATVSERQHLRRLALEQSDIAFDRLLFSIKESTYKAWFPLVRAWVNFDDADVRISRDGCFLAPASSLVLPVPPWHTPLRTS